MEDITKLHINQAAVWSPELEQEISCENNRINNLSFIKLKEQAKKYELNTKGSAKILRSRLKAYLKHQKLVTCKTNSPEDRYLVIIDFEATCNNENNLPKQEIIEFPAILFDSEERKLLKEFRSYVKPIINPKLTDFCQKLTGITQTNIDNAPYFPEVLNNFEKWLQSNGLNVSDPNFTILTDGSSDISLYLLGQCGISGLQFPKWGEKWLNIKKSYCNFYQYYRLSLTEMLKYAGMQLRGRLHKGIDDARNISRIVDLLLEDGVDLVANECLVEDPTTSMGYAVANIIKVDNKTSIEKKIYTEKKTSSKQTKCNFILDNKDFPVLI